MTSLANLAACRTLLEALRCATQVLQASQVASPRLDAELLLAAVLGIDRTQLVLQARSDLPQERCEEFIELVKRRAYEREPVAYILGRRAFRNLDLYVDRRVLIPRPETELLVEWALKLPLGQRVIDLCTGSGAVALALKDERPDLEVLGADLSDAALAVARKNARQFALDVTFLKADLLYFPDGTPICQRGDVVIANPPYVPESEWLKLDPEVFNHEPSLALRGGEDGLATVRRLVSQAATQEVHALALEIGYGQADTVQQVFTEAGFDKIERISDLAGIERVVCGGK